MRKRKEPFKFVCNKCGKEFVGNKDKSNENWCVCTKDDRCEYCGGEIEMVLND